MKKMSERRFFELFAKVASQIAFKVSPTSGLLRQRETERCPLCAVGQHVTGKKKYTKQDLWQASEDLGLPLDFAINVAYAADNVSSMFASERQKQILKIRRKLLRLAGFTL